MDVAFGPGMAAWTIGRYSGGGGNINGSIKFDIGINLPAITPMGVYYTSFWGMRTGLDLSFSDYVLVSIPVEYVFSSKYDIMEFLFSSGPWIGFGGGGFSYGFGISGAIGWKAGPGTINLEGQLGYGFLGIDLFGKILLGYKLGLL
jgi:hypothetical protein